MHIYRAGISCEDILGVRCLFKKSNGYTNGVGIQLFQVNICWTHKWMHMMPTRREKIAGWERKSSICFGQLSKRVLIMLLKNSKICSGSIDITLIERSYYGCIAYFLRSSSILITLVERTYYACRAYLLRLRSVSLTLVKRTYYACRAYLIYLYSVVTMLLQFTLYARSAYWMCSIQRTYQVQPAYLLYYPTASILLFHSISIFVQSIPTYVEDKFIQFNT